MTVLYEDNHIIIVAKRAGDIVQGDRTGDRTLADDVKAYIKEKYAKPGDVFLGIPHRLDRPVSGVCLFARTSKALERLNRMFRDGLIRKTYHAILTQAPEPPEATLTHYLTRDTVRNKAFAHLQPAEGAKQAVLDYRTLARGERYTLVEIQLHTGRHHQIRCQLAAIGCPIRGDLKYGAPRSNPGGGISLHARRIAFEHPVSHIPIDVTAPYPEGDLWNIFD